MNYLKKIRKNPWHVLLTLAGHGMFDWMPDKPYLQLMYRGTFGKKLDLNTPRTLNEKIQWLKLYDRKNRYTDLVDKYRVKEIVGQIVGQEYIIPTLGVWESFDEIDFNKLPNQFVLKCTHDSGGIVIVKDKNTFDRKAAKNKIEKSLKYNFFKYGREWPYKKVHPRVIAEQYMGDNLHDYKLFCFGGMPRITLVCSERFKKNGLKEDFYDEAWNHLDIRRPGHENAILPIQKPKQYELMKRLATTLSKEIPFARIDFYEIDEKVYFGEITFYPASGFEGFSPNGWDLKMGEWIKLPNK